jgi:hypothetical protein
MPDKRPGGPLPGQTGTQQKNPAPGKGTEPAKPSPGGKGGGGKK